MGLVDAAVEHHLGGPLGQLLGRHLGQQRDRIVVDLPPPDRIEVAEQVDDFRMPAPPQVRGQGQALVVERLRRQLGEIRLAHAGFQRRCFDRVHAMDLGLRRWLPIEFLSVHAARTVRQSLQSTAL